MLELRIQEAMSSGLHDYKVGDISVDYCCDKINLTLTSPGGEACRLSIPGFRLLQMTRTEPWGPGIYVVYSDLTEMEDRRKRLLLQLNSGDEITVQIVETENP